MTRYLLDITLAFQPEALPSPAEALLGRSVLSQGGFPGHSPSQVDSPILKDKLRLTNHHDKQSFRAGTRLFTPKLHAAETPEINHVSVGLSSSSPLESTPNGILSFFLYLLIFKGIRRTTIGLI